MTPKRLSEIRFSDPYTKSHRGLVVLDHERREFRDLLALQERHNFRIAVLPGSSHEQSAHRIFPNATIIPVDGVDNFLEIADIDAYFWTIEEAGPWALAHPQYSVVTTTPSLGGDYHAVALHDEATDLMTFVNYWLSLKELDGLTERQYNKWILGQDDRPSKRWSIIKDVLHWVE